MLDSRRWTYEKTTTLEQMWIAGEFSADEIGKKLGYSKSAITGKAHRLNLPKRRGEGGRLVDNYRPPRKYSPSEAANRVQRREALIAAARELRSKGWRFPEIQQKLSVSYRWAYEHTRYIETPDEVSGAGGYRPCTPSLAKPKPLDPVIEVLFSETPGANRVKLLDHVEGQCRWPYGDTDDNESFRFCGDDCQVELNAFGLRIRSAYCGKHHALAYKIVVA